MLLLFSIVQVFALLVSIFVVEDIVRHFRSMLKRWHFLGQSGRYDIEPPVARLELLCFVLMATWLSAIVSLALVASIYYTTPE